MRCFLCGQLIHPDLEKEIESYKLVATVGLKGDSEVDITIGVNCSKTPLCLPCAMNVARQGINKLYDENQIFNFST